MFATFRKRKRAESGSYPPQFWILLLGGFISRSSISMTWPFVTIFVRGKVGRPLTDVTLLLTVQAVATVISTFLIGAIMDRFGRKGAMVVSLFGSAIVLFMMSLADTFALWVVLMALFGIVDPAFRVGVETMVADIVPEGKRSSAYAILRMVFNVGIAIGPVIGGVLAQSSFELIYRSVSVVYLIVGILVLVFVHETIPKRKNEDEEKSSIAGYSTILKDGVFMSFFVFIIMTGLGFTNVFVLLPPYTEEHFGFEPSQYSLFLSVNAAMVVFLQYNVTQFTKRFPSLRMMALGALFYAGGLFSVVLATELLHFIISMIIVTMGELILLPTAAAFVANHAPIDMRARYMGIFALMWPLSAGIGPVFGGFLNDTISPFATWYGAGGLAFLGALGFLWLSSRTETVTPEPSSVRF